MAFSLLATGAYLIAEQFANPVQAQSTELVFSALLIATAVTLLYSLVHPTRKQRHRIAAWPIVSWGDERTAVARSTPRLGEDQTILPMQNRYVDHALVRIQR